MPHMRRSRLARILLYLLSPWDVGESMAHQNLRFRNFPFCSGPVSCHTYCDYPTLKICLSARQQVRQRFFFFRILIGNHSEKCLSFVFNFVWFFVSFSYTRRKHSYLRFCFMRQNLQNVNGIGNIKYVKTFVPLPFRERRRSAVFGLTRKQNCSRDLKQLIPSWRDKAFAKIFNTILFIMQR